MHPDTRTLARVAFAFMAVLLAFSVLVGWSVGQADATHALALAVACAAIAALL